MDNLFEVIVGHQTLRWDAVWRVTNWLLTPDEGHGCGSSFLRSLSMYLFGNEAAQCWSRCEYKLLHRHNGKEKWPDLCAAMPNRESAQFVALMDDFVPPQRSSEKFDNLKTYYNLGKKEFSSAEVRVAVVTTIPDAIQMRRCCSDLDLGSPASECANWWMPLPLGLMGSWVDEAVSVHSPPVKSRLFLNDFVSWSKSFGS